MIEVSKSIGGKPVEVSELNFVSAKQVAKSDLEHRATPLLVDPMVVSLLVERGNGNTYIRRFSGDAVEMGQLYKLAASRLTS